MNAKEYLENKGYSFHGRMSVTPKLSIIAKLMEEYAELRLSDVVGQSKQLCDKCKREKQLQNLTDQAQELGLGYDD